MSKEERCNIPVSVPWRSTGTWRDVRIWLIGNIKDANYDLGGVDMLNLDNRIVRFAREQDAVLFSLTWS